MNYKFEQISKKANMKFLSKSDQFNEKLENKSPNCLKEAIISIKNGRNIKKSFNLIKLELTDPQKQNVSCKAVLDCDLVSYILPYCSIESEVDILVDAIDIIQYISMSEQPEDSPFQNKQFFLNLLDIIKNNIDSNIIIIILIIIYNLLCDDIIESVIHDILMEIDIIGSLSCLNLFDLKSEYLQYSSGVLVQILHGNTKEETLKMNNIFSLIVNILESCNDTITHYNFLESLSLMLIYSEFHQIAYDYNISNILLKSLKLYHDESLIYVFKSIYNLCLNEHFPPEFLTNDFFLLCDHLLFTSNTNLIENILRTLELFIPRYYQNLWDNNIITGLLSLLKESTCSIRFNCTGFILNFLNYSTDKQIIEINNLNGFDFILDSVGSFDFEDISQSLDILKNLLTRGPDVYNIIISSKSMHTLLDELINDPNPEVSSLGQYYRELFSSI